MAHNEHIFLTQLEVSNPIQHECVHFNIRASELENYLKNQQTLQPVELVSWYISNKNVLIIVGEPFIQLCNKLMCTVILLSILSLQAFHFINEWSVSIFWPEVEKIPRGEKRSPKIQLKQPKTKLKWTRTRIKILQNAFLLRFLY